VEDIKFHIDQEQDQKGGDQQSFHHGSGFCFGLKGKVGEKHQNGRNKNDFQFDILGYIPLAEKKEVEEQIKDQKSCERMFPGWFNLFHYKKNGENSAREEEDAEFDKE